MVARGYKQTRVTASEVETGGSQASMESHQNSSTCYGRTGIYAPPNTPHIEREEHHQIFSVKLVYLSPSTRFLPHIPGSLGTHPIRGLYIIMQPMNKAD